VLINSSKKALQITFFFLNYERNRRINKRDRKERRIDRRIKEQTGKRRDIDRRTKEQIRKRRK